MPSANVVALQTAVNRIAQQGAFSPIAVDGGLGPQTNQGVMNALAWIVHNVPARSDSATGLVSSLADGDLQSNIAQSAQGLAAFLDQSANEAGLPAAPSTSAVPSSGGGFLPSTWVTNNPFTTGNGPVASAIATWQKLSRLQQVGAVVGGVIGIIVIRNAIRKRKSK